MADPVPASDPNTSKIGKSAYVWAMLAAFCVSVSLFTIKVHCVASSDAQWRLPEVARDSAQWTQINQLYDSAIYLQMGHVLFDPGSSFLMAPFILFGMVAYLANKGTEGSFWSRLIQVMRFYAISFLTFFLPGLFFAYSGTALLHALDACTMIGASFGFWFLLLTSAFAVCGPLEISPESTTTLGSDDQKPTSDAPTTDMPGSRSGGQYIKVPKKQVTFS